MAISNIHRQLNERLWLAFAAIVCVYSPVVLGFFVYKGLTFPYQSWVFSLELVLQASMLGADLCLHRLRRSLGLLGVTGLGVSFVLSFYALVGQQNILHVELILTSVYVVCKGAVLVSELGSVVVEHVVKLCTC